MHLRFWVLLLWTTILSLYSCSGSKHILGTKPAAGLRSEAAVLYYTMMAGDDYTWYTGKARIKAITPYEKMSATINLRMLRDSVIWATIDKLGFEIARVLITPDSVFVVDRLNKEYTRKSLAGFLNEHGVIISFGDLQNALIGKMIALTPTHLESKTENDLEILVVYDFTGVTAKHWFTMTLPKRLIKSDLVDTTGRKLLLENGAWETSHDGSQIPYGRVLTFEDTDGVTEIELIFSEITRNVPVNIPFSIPAHYAAAR